jgi:hypothetical protein
MLESMDLEEAFGSAYHQQVEGRPKVEPMVHKIEQMESKSQEHESMSCGCTRCEGYRDLVRKVKSHPQQKERFDESDSGDYVRIPESVLQAIINRRSQPEGESLRDYELDYKILQFYNVFLIMIIIFLLIKMIIDTIKRKQ